jgi:hypothetical protein
MDVTAVSQSRFLPEIFCFNRVAKPSLNIVKSIVGLDDSSLNNFEPLAEPPRAGAARVKEYQSGWGENLILKAGYAVADK